MHLRNDIQVACFRGLVGVITLSAGWILAGCGGRLDTDPVSLAVIPISSSIALGNTAQVKVFAIDREGAEKDVTGAASLRMTGASVATVSSSGLVKSVAVGKTSLVATMSGLQGEASITVTKAALTGMTIATPPSSIALGLTAQLRATGTYTDASVEDITSLVNWSAAQPNVIAVSPTGMAAAEAVGSTQITASLSGLSASSQISVSPAALVSVTVNVVRAALPLGGTEQLTASGSYTDGNTKDLTSSANWSSSSPGVIAVSNTGTVTAKSIGAAVISASASNITGNANLSASSASLVSIAVAAANSSLPLGNGEQLTATGSYTDGSRKDLTSSVSWSSSSPGIVTVSSIGVITAKGIGNAVVSASSSPIVGKADFAISAAALVGISMSSANTTVPVGDTVKLSLIGSFTDHSTKDLSDFATWTSSAPGVLSVTGSGVAAGLSIGTASVAASYESYSAMVGLSVSAPVVSALRLAPAGPALPLGATLQLSVIGTYSDGSTRDVTQQVTWNLDNSAIASVNATGLVSALQIGTSGIEANLNGIQAADVLTVQPLSTIAYFNAATGIDSTIRITNPAITGEDLCAMVYVFDQDQQMSECCGCAISQNGLLTLSLNNNLLNNPLTGVKSKSGTVMLVAADKTSNTSCNASTFTPAGMVIAWSTHLSQPASGQMSSAEETLSNSPLSPTLSSALQAQCAFIQELGSGQGACNCGIQH